MSSAANTSASKHPLTARVSAERSGAYQSVLGYVVALAALVAEASLWAAYGFGQIGTLAALALHGAILVLLVVIPMSVPPRRLGWWGASLVALTAAAGPLGPLLALVIERGAQNSEPIPVLEDWYERIALAHKIDPISQRCDDVALGRSVDLGAPPPVSFARIMEEGTLAERQATLGHIARHVHPDYLPALAIALRSPEPVIRVQAAAVATRARPALRQRIDEALLAVETGALSSSEARASLQQMERLITSGLLDVVDEERARAVAARLRSRVAENIDRLSARQFLRLASLGRVDEEMERQLIERRRFRNLRQARQAARLRARGSFMVRYLRERRRRSTAAIEKGA